ncbi:MULTISPECIES: glycosyl hydrolase [unclassified Streptomyces]|uniref:glycoside hydrolase 5 family protein n=1 Tax=unclassified Streptomyces TaxID=2593676 RepID=UPI002E186806|nr:MULTISPECIES: glycosyl hydrolase [unclassified Streptomyces]
MTQHAPPNPRFGANYTPSKDWFYGWYHLDKDAASADFEQIAALGLDHVRLFCLWPHIQPNRSYIDEHVLDDLADLVARAHAAGLDTNVDVLQGHMSGMEFMPAWLSTRHRRSIYADPDVVAAEEELLTAVAARLREVPGFLGITLGNEMNLLVGEYPTTTDEVGAWLPRLLAACRRGAPGATHLHSTYDAAFYLPDHPFTPEHVGGEGDVAAVHSWVFNGTVQRYGSGSVQVERHAEYLIQLATAHLDDPARPVWLQEVGAPRPLIADADVESFVHATVRGALDCTGLWGVTWWSSHAVDRRFTDFNDLEHELGLYGADGTPTPTGRAFADAVAEARAKPTLPAPRTLAVRLPDNAPGADPRGEYGPGGRVFDTWMRLAAAGARPALVRGADAALRGISEVVGVDPAA